MHALSLLLFALLVVGYLGFGVQAIPRGLRAALPTPAARALAGPAALVAACALYAAARGLAVAPRAAAYGALALAPALLLAWGANDPASPPRRPPLRELAAALFLGAIAKWHLLPALLVPAPASYDASRLVALDAGLYAFLVVRPIGGVGFTWALRGRDVGAAAAAFAAYVPVAVPIGLTSGFIAWTPHPDAAGLLLRPLLIFVVTALPEEFLYRGLIQNLLTRWLGPRAALAIASVVFGLSHLPDPRYALLATLAGAAYGWVYLRTGKITASALTHTLVDATWVVLFR